MEAAGGDHGTTIALAAREGARMRRPSHFGVLANEIYLLSERDLRSLEWLRLMTRRPCGCDIVGRTVTS